MSVGNLKDQGNKGNNFPYQRSVLELLGQISASTSSACCPTAATELTLQQIAGTGSKESTLQQVLAAIQGGSLFFNNLVIDTGAASCSTPAGCPTYSEVKVWNGVGFDTTYYNADGVVITPVGPLEYVNPQYVLNDILLQNIAINNNTANIVTNTSTIISNTNDISIDTGNIAGNSLATASNTNTTAVNSNTIVASLNTSNTRLGALTETAPATDTASSGLNGRLQRIAQRLSTLITALGTPLQAGGNIGNVGSITNTVNVAQVEKTGVSGVAGPITTTAATDVILAPGTGLFIYITQILVTNAHPTVGTLVTIRTQAGTNLFTGYVTAAGGRYSVSFPVAIKMPIANQKLQAICGTTGASVYVSASGYKAV
jgi:hypothetical protein